MGVLGGSFGGCGCRQTKCPDVNGTLIASITDTENDWPAPHTVEMSGPLKREKSHVFLGVGNSRIVFTPFVKPGACFRIVAEAHYTRDRIIYDPADTFFQNPITVHGDDNLGSPTAVSDCEFRSIAAGPFTVHHDNQDWIAYDMYEAVPASCEERFKPHKFDNPFLQVGLGVFYSDAAVAVEYVMKAPLVPGPGWPPGDDGQPRPLILSLTFQVGFFWPGFQRIIKVYAIGDVFQQEAVPDWTG
jgi:hypothetical protein